MLVKGLSLLATYLVGRAANHSEKEEAGFFSNLTTGMIKKAALVVALYALSLLVFIFGAVIVTADLIWTSKQVDGIGLSPLSWVGLGVIVLAAIIAASVSFMDFKRDKVTLSAPKQKPVNNNLSPIGEVLTVFVMDFIRERRRKRELAEAERRAYSSRLNEEYPQGNSVPHMN
ncbi:MAG: hypothetical protein V4736_06490 [Bdellovibrionota bacterium]